MTKYEDGVYFNMPEAEYHKIPALSASGIKNLLISPVDFWARSWMNPRYQFEEDTDAQIVGTAYHKRICEGRDLFYSHYAPTFTGEDLPARVDDLRAALKSWGHKTDGNSNDLIARCARLGIATYATARADYMAKNDGKTFVSADLIDSIEISAAMIEMHPVLSKCFKGGYPEVTVIWTEEHTIERAPTEEEIAAAQNEDLMSVLSAQPMPTEKIKIRFKARFDYLKPRAVVDLKTFENRGNKSVDRAIYGTIASYKYHIQATFYLRAVQKAQKFCEHDRLLPPDAPKEEIRVFGNSHPRNEIIAFCEKLRQTEEHDFYFVFQQKGIAPFARGYKFPRTTMWSVGNAQIDAAIRLYKDCLQKFGEGQWVDDAQIEELADEGFPVWASTDL